MRRISAAVAGAALILCWTPAANPAEAVSPFAIEAAWDYPVFGGSGFDGWFAGTATGVVSGHVYLNANAFAEFSYNTGGGACPATDVAAGTIRVWDGVAEDRVDFNWTRIGAVAVLTFDRGGAAVATFAPTSVPRCSPPGRLMARVVITGTFDV